MKGQNGISADGLENGPLVVLKWKNGSAVVQFLIALTGKNSKPWCKIEQFPKQ